MAPEPTPSELCKLQKELQRQRDKINEMQGEGRGKSQIINIVVPIAAALVIGFSVYLATELSGIATIVQSIKDGQTAIINTLQRIEVNPKLRGQDTDGKRSTESKGEVNAGTTGDESPIR